MAAGQDTHSANSNRLPPPNDFESFPSEIYNQYYTAFNKPLHGSGCMAKELNTGPSGARHRTGTMEFMAIEVLQGHTHTYRHDLKFFLYVFFLWTIIRYGPECGERGFAGDSKFLFGRGLVFEDEIAGTAEQWIKASDATSGSSEVRSGEGYVIIQPQSMYFIGQLVTHPPKTTRDLSIKVQSSFAPQCWFSRLKK